MNTLELSKIRRATKSFISEKKIPREDLLYILEVANNAPSSIGLESTRFVVINSDEIKEQTKKEFTFNESKFMEASDIVLFVTKNEKALMGKWIIDQLKETLTSKLDSSDKALEIAPGYALYVEKSLNSAKTEHSIDYNSAVVEWSAKQAYTQMGYMMLAAEEKGVQSLPVEGYDYVSLAKKLRKLNLIGKDEFVSVSLFLGYRNREAENGGQFGKLTRLSMDKKVKIV